MPTYSTTIQGDSNATPAPVSVANATLAVTQSGIWTVALSAGSIDIGKVDQGVAGTLANAWPVELSDGTNLLGVTAHPVRTDPTGTTTQPISGSVSITGTAAVTQSTSPWVVSLTSTTITGTVAVTQSTSPWVISGTVTSNIGTTNGLALDATVSGLQVTQGSTTSGQKGGLILGAVTTSAPTYTTAQSSPLSLDTAGNLRVTLAASSAEQNVNLNQVGGAAIALGQTTMSASLPVTIASNQSTLPVSLTSTTITGTVAVTQSTSPWVVSGTVTANAGTGTFTVGQATGTNLHTVIDSGTITSVTSITNALPAGTNVIGHVIADSGSTTVVTGNVTVVQATGTNLHAVVDSGTVTANIGTTNGLALDATVAKLTLAQGSTTSGQTGALILGAVTTAAPTYTTAQSSPLSLTTTGALRIALDDGAGTSVTVGQKTMSASLPVVIASDNGIIVAQGSTTSGQSGPLIQGAVTTAAPTYTTGQTSPLSLDTTGHVRAQPAPPTDITASGTINALNGAVTATTNGTGSTVFQLTGTFVATFVAEGSVDNTNWTNLTIFPASGQSTTGGVTAVSSYRIPSTSGYAQMRVRCSAYTSGTATVQMNLSEVVGAPQLFSPNAQNCLVGASNVDGYKATYSAAITGLAMAATPTDVFTITGSSTKTIRVTRIYLTGTQTTGNTSNVLLIRRSTANTVGTSTSPTVVQNDTNDAAGTAVVRAYTANPTLGTTVGTMASYAIFIPAAQPANANSPFITPDLFAAIRPAEAIVLRGTTQVLAVNFNSVTVTGNAMNIFIEWTEE